MALLDRSPHRRTRAGLPASVRRDAAAAVAGTWRRTPELAAVRRLGAYVAVRGEFDPVCIVAAARAGGATVYVPEVVADEARGGPTLRFVELAPGAVLGPGAFGIPVPGPDAVRVAPDELDTVLVPLVAFDATGTRVGAGAGCYDRAFAAAPGRVRPRLVGLAYAWQEVPSLPREPWDVPLDEVLTERGRRELRAR